MGKKLRKFNVEDKVKTTVDTVVFQTVDKVHRKRWAFILSLYYQIFQKGVL